MSQRERVTIRADVEAASLMELDNGTAETDASMLPLSIHLYHRPPSTSFFLTRKTVIVIKIHIITNRIDLGFIAKCKLLWIV